MNFIIDKKEVGVKFNNYAIEQMAHVKGLGNSSSAYLTAVLWGGYQGWCFAKQIDPEVTFEQISDYADRSLTEKEEGKVMKLIIAEYTSSKHYESLIKKTDSEKKKPKLARGS